MTILTLFKLYNYGLVLLFGLLLSIKISGEHKTLRQRPFVVFLIFLALCLLQTAAYCVLGEDTTWKLYPLIIHFPLVLILIFVWKRTISVTCISIATAYLCCQLPRWGNQVVLAWTESALAAEVCYSLFLFISYVLLRRYFCDAAYETMTYSTQSLILFGSLPLAYYIFDYVTTVYNDIFQIQLQAISEFLPTALILFYVLFLTAYHTQTEKSAQAKLLTSMLEAERKQWQTEMEILRQAESKVAVVQHDLRHHLILLDGLIHAGETEQASAYIHNITNQIDAITPKRFCENETVNLLCSFYDNKAAQMGITLVIKVDFPASLTITDAELCAVLSNGLENAFHAVADMEDSFKRIEFYCRVDHDRLLIEIRNPHSNEVLMHNDTPTSEAMGHGYGCRSIRTIVEEHHGHCQFLSENQIFTLRIVLPIH